MSVFKRACYGALLASLAVLFITVDVSLCAPLQTQAPTLGGGHTMTAVVGSKLFGPHLPPKRTVVLISRGGVPQADDGELFVVTAYTAGEESTGKRPGDPGYGITATGTQAAEGRTAACDPQVLPMGTKIKIDGVVGVLTCSDTGGAIKGARIDVFMNDLDKALQFGRQILKVRVLG